jgi:hypothetical protein
MAKLMVLTAFLGPSNLIIATPVVVISTLVKYSYLRVSVGVKGSFDLVSFVPLVTDDVGVTGTETKAAVVD